MRVETIEQVAKLIPTVSALLAGFSFTMIRGVMFHRETPRLTTVTLICFVAAAAAMLTVTFNATYMLINIAVANGQPGQPGASNLRIAEDLIHLTKWIFYGGLICLFAGGGLLGWLHSKRAGVFGSAIMLVAAAVILRTIVVLGTKL